MNAMNQRSTLCLRHRRALELDPLRAEDCWQQAMHNARHEISAKQWQRAKYRYFHALEVAEILLHNDQHPKRCTTRLIATSREYAYLLRAMSISTHGITQYLRGCLVHRCQAGCQSSAIDSRPIKEMTASVATIETACQKECAAWLRAIASTHLGANQTLH